jgi:hypothetical protein
MQHRSFMGASPVIPVRIVAQSPFTDTALPGLRSQSNVGRFQTVQRFASLSGRPQRNSRGPRPAAETVINDYGFRHPAGLRHGARICQGACMPVSLRAFSGRRMDRWIIFRQHLPAVALAAANASSST